MKTILFFICLFFFLIHTSCYTPKEALNSNGRPCVVVPDSLKIRNHGEARIRFLYKKEGDNINLFYARVTSYYDIQKDDFVSNIYPTMVNLEDEKYENTYLNPVWAKKVFFEYYAQHTELFLEREALQLELNRQAKTELVLFGFNIYTCPPAKRKRR